MGQPVVHFEIIGKDPAKLRSYFGELFGWEFDTSSPVAEAVSEPMNYGFVNRIVAGGAMLVAVGILEVTGAWSSALLWLKTHWISSYQSPL